MLKLIFALAFVLMPLTTYAEMGRAAKGLLVGPPMTAPQKPDCDDGDGVIRFAERTAGRIATCDSKFGVNTPDDVNCYDRKSPVDWLRPANIRDNLNAMAEGMFFQELFGNSERQAICRMDYINLYNQNPDSHAKMNSRAEEEFNKVKKRIRALIEYRQTLAKEQHDWGVVADGAAGRGGSDLRETANAYGKLISEVNETIYRLALPIPMAHETEVLNSIETMAVEDKFDPAAYQNAVTLCGSKYKTAVEYFKKNERSAGAGKIRYCADDDFRHHAGRSGEIRRWVNTIEATTKSEIQFRNRLACRLDAQYESGPANLQKGVMITGFVLGVATLGASALGEAGIGSAVAAGTWISAASTGMDAVGLVMASDAIRRDCFSATYVSSADRNKCDGATDFEHEVVERNLSACAINGAMTMASIPLHVVAYLKLKKVPLDAEVEVVAARLSPTNLERKNC